MSGTSRDERNEESGKVVVGLTPGETDAEVFAPASDTAVQGKVSRAGEG